MAQSRRRHPVLEGTPAGVWQPEAVGKVRGYPRTAEAYARRVENLKATSDKARAEGRLNRRGSANGWAGRRDEVSRLRQEAMLRADDITRALRNSQGPDERLEAELAIPTSDEARVDLAMRYFIATIISPTYGTSYRIKAARILLPYLVPKPTKGRPVIGLDEALQFLDGLVEEPPPPGM